MEDDLSLCVRGAALFYLALALAGAGCGQLPETLETREGSAGSRASGRAATAVGGRQWEGAEQWEQLAVIWQLQWEPAPPNGIVGGIGEI